MADVFINGDTGDDATGDGSPTGGGTGPYKTWEKAYTEANDGDTIKLEAATYDQSTQGAFFSLDPDDDAKGVITEPAVDGTTVTVDNQGGASVQATLIQIKTDATLTLNNLILLCDNTTSGATHPMIQRQANKTGSLLSTGCTFTHTDDGGPVHEFFEDVAVEQGGEVIFTNCTITSEARNVGFATGHLDLLKLDNTDFTTVGASSLSGGNKVVFDITGNTKNIEITGNSTINCVASVSGGFGFNHSGNEQLENLLVRGSTMLCYNNCINITSSSVRVIDIRDEGTIRNTFTSITGDAVSFGKEPLASGVWSGPQMDVSFIGSDCRSSNGRGGYFQEGCDGAEIGYCFFEGTTHTFSVGADRCHIHHITSTGALPIANFGHGNNIHNVTLYANVQSPGYLTGGPSGAVYNSWRNATGNRFWNCIMVVTHADSYPYRDYETSIGDDNNPRGFSLLLDETVADTTIAGAVMTGTGSAWATIADGATNRLVHVNDIVRFTAGTGVTLGDFLVKSVDSDTQLTLYAAPGNYVAADMVYTILRNDFMREYCDYNVYWSTASNKVASVGDNSADNSGTPVLCTTIDEMRTAWGTAGKSGASWNPMFDTINDQHSLNVDPQFANAAGGDFRPLNSALLTAGKPDPITGNPTPIGATALEFVGNRHRLRPRYDPAQFGYKI